MVVCPDPLLDCQAQVICTSSPSPFPLRRRWSSHVASFLGIFPSELCIFIAHSLCSCYMFRTYHAACETCAGGGEYVNALFSDLVHGSLVGCKARCLISHEISLQVLEPQASHKVVRMSTMKVYSGVEVDVTQS
jgi:hypothetical protein